MGAQQSRVVSSRPDEKSRSANVTSRTAEQQLSVREKQSSSPRLYRQPEGLTLNQAKAWHSSILADPKNRLAQIALNSTNPRTVLTSSSTEIADQQVFNVKIPFEGGPITNQNRSGRCWLFASTNVFRVALMKRYNLEEFELSQAYLHFWDKLEKANWFLEQIMDTACEDLEGRLVQTLLGDIVSDGGQWDMVFNLVQKYGIVPQTLYPDNASAKNTGAVNSILKTKLREFALTLRSLSQCSSTSADQLSEAKEKMMQEVMLILTLCYGAPPNPQEPFTWQYVDKDGKAQQLTTTPAAFSQDIYSASFRINTNTIDAMVSLVNDPRHDYLNMLAVPRLGNVVGGRSISYVNVDMDTLKTTCISMLKAGIPIFFGCDVGQFSDSQSGIMDLDLFDYELGFNTSLLSMSKAQRVRTSESQMTHAMVLTAVHIDEKTGKSVRWRVQNSWGATAGDKGWFVMSDAWMDEFVYQAVVDPRFLSKEVRDVLTKTPIELPLWDPMGSLAQ